MNTDRLGYDSPKDAFCMTPNIPRPRSKGRLYHPAGTTKMGDIKMDPMAVVDPQLKIKGLQGVRIADASVFPEMPSINPMLTVLAIGERCAEMVAQNWGWDGLAKPKL